MFQFFQPSTPCFTLFTKSLPLPQAPSVPVNFAGAEQVLLAQAPQDHIPFYLL